MLSPPSTRNSEARKLSMKLVDLAMVSRVLMKYSGRTVQMLSSAYLSAKYLYALFAFRMMLGISVYSFSESFISPDLTACLNSNTIRRRWIEPPESAHPGTSLPASTIGTSHSCMNAFWCLMATEISSPDTIDWNSACSMARSFRISGAHTNILSKKAEIPNFRSMLLDRIPTSTVSKNCLMTFRTSRDLPVPARPTKKGHTCQESISLVL
ncbi:hypothetical protein MT325_m677L [Paramecium bursaria chlorella virus MT325]|uniref:Uncharacterized protein m677L n=2 Tax=Paramecium bursaria Chlorella virus A1 TaxID=381899 RepID=A7IV57_PBCVM|nr:hypothetical protein FR483_n677L [Paramecium bursaria Chlorella virus FR483]ABT14231.1 hypothetical protein MT325_m677L [Paramecium bursaria chlorella virus MT325]ABT15962.1 hypothetical protein FR483_n677L [Paramecium bursaria Chlorella virus FR483]